MKKYACLLVLALLLNGCDDGDLTIETINFDSIDPVSCTSTADNSNTTTPTILYKLKPQEAFILQLPKTNGLVNDNGTEEYDIDNNTYRLLYRAYNGAVAKDNICGTIPPSTPNVTEEWLATAGKIKIVTSQRNTDPDSNGATRINGYTHSITIEDVTYLKPSGPVQVEELIEYGNYVTVVDQANLAFQNADTGEAYKCEGNTRIYNYNAAFTFIVESFDPALLTNEATPAGQPRSQEIGTTKNKVVYRTFQSGTGTITSAYDFCSTTPPSLPTVSETWVGAADAQSGKKALIEVTTEAAGSSFIHTIVLRNVSLTKGNSSFKLGDTFVIGKITL